MYSATLFGFESVFAVVLLVILLSLFDINS
jgi:hypothetical protein